MTILNLKSVAVAFLAATAGVRAQEEGDVPNTVMFVNQFPDVSIDLYWENHGVADDHPDRRKLEAKIAPRGGWHASETFVGHGKYLVHIICSCAFYF